MLLSPNRWWAHDFIQFLKCLPRCVLKKVFQFLEFCLLSWTRFPRRDRGPYYKLLFLLDNMISMVNYELDLRICLLIMRCQSRFEGSLINSMDLNAFFILFAFLLTRNINPSKLQRMTTTWSRSKRPYHRPMKMWIAEVRQICLPISCCPQFSLPVGQRKHGQALYCELPIYAGDAFLDNVSQLDIVLALI